MAYTALIGTLFGMGALMPLEMLSFFEFAVTDSALSQNHDGTRGRKAAREARGCGTDGVLRVI